MASSHDTHFDALPEALQLHALDQQLPYIATKAARYLEVGPDEYRNTDAFGQPATREADELAAIQRGCEQLIECKGLHAESPLVDIGVGGFYALMALFHFIHTHMRGRADRAIPMLKGYGGVVDHSNGACFAPVKCQKFQ